MRWSDLSIDAKNVIEWLENPFTGAFKRIEIKVGDKFIRHETCVEITQKLFDEIARYTTEDDNICGAISHDNKTHWFEFKEEYKLNGK